MFSGMPSVRCPLTLTRDALSHYLDFNEAWQKCSPCEWWALLKMLSRSEFKGQCHSDGGIHFDAMACEAGLYILKKNKTNCK